MQHAARPCSVDPGASPAGRPPARPWGLFAAMAIALAIGLVHVVVVPLAVIIAYGIAYGIAASHADVSAAIASFAKSGECLAVSTCASTPVALLLVVIAVRLRKGMCAREYLAVRSTGMASLAKWTGALLLIAAASDGLTWWLGRPLVPDVMTDLYRSTTYRSLLWLALIVAAPVFEEVLFRGFLFESLQQSVLRPTGAVLVTSALWAGVHLQYDAYGIATIFAFGTVLGLARLRTRSICPCILMHALMNSIASVEVAVLVAQG